MLVIQYKTERLISYRLVRIVINCYGKSLCVVAEASHIFPSQPRFFPSKGGPAAGTPRNVLFVRLGVLAAGDFVKTGLARLGKASEW